MGDKGVARAFGDRFVVKHTVYIDGKPVVVREDLKRLGSALQAKGVLPNFCFYNELEAPSCAGACHVYCMRSKKVLLACTMANMPGVKVSIKHKDAMTARQKALILIASNQPNDAALSEKKYNHMLGNAVANNKACGEQRVRDESMTPPAPLDVVMRAVPTRCMHCQLCVEFYKNNVGLPMLELSRDTGVSVLGEQNAPSVFSGNLLEICPSGALVPDRVWSGSVMQEVPGFDLQDAALTPLVWRRFESYIVDVRPPQKVPYRWLSNRARFSLDGLVLNRVQAPEVREQGFGKIVSWESILSYAVEQFQKIGWGNVGVLVGPFVDAETLVTLSILMQEVGIKHCALNAGHYPATFQEETRDYTFGGPLDRVLCADAIILVGAAPLYDMPILHTLLVRYRNEKRGPIFSLGSFGTTEYAQCVGRDRLHLTQLAQGRGVLASALRNAKKPLFICGEHVVCDGHANIVWGMIRKIAARYNQTANWAPIAFVPLCANTIQGLDIKSLTQDQGLTSAGIKDAVAQGYLKGLWCIGYYPEKSFWREDTLVVLQGTHDDAVYRGAQVIMPSEVHTEHAGSYVDAEGQLKCTEKVTNPRHNVRDDVWILQEIIRLCNSHYQARSRDQLTSYVQSLYETHFGKKGEKRLSSSSLGSTVIQLSDAWIPEEYPSSVPNIVAKNSIKMQKIYKDSAVKRRGVW